MQDVLTDDQAKKILAANVRRLRGERSLGWLAKQIGTHAIYISRIEAGKSMPGIGVVSRLAEALGVAIDDLLRPAKKTSRTAG